MGKLRPRAWFGLALLSVLALGSVFFVGLAAPGLDVREKCELAGQTLDMVYREQHSGEPGQFFPLHDKCNADYDLVPGWINPALVFFAVLAAALLLGFLVSATTVTRTRL
jgi:hypothetical protein